MCSISTYTAPKTHKAARRNIRWRVHVEASTESSRQETGTCTAPQSQAAELVTGSELTGCLCEGDNLCSPEDTRSGTFNSLALVEHRVRLLARLLGRLAERDRAQLAVPRVRPAPEGGCGGTTTHHVSSSRVVRTSRRFTTMMRNGRMRLRYGSGPAPAEDDDVARLGRVLDRRVAVQLEAVRGVVDLEVAPRERLELEHEHLATTEPSNPHRRNHQGHQPPPPPPPKRSHHRTTKNTNQTTPKTPLTLFHFTPAARTRCTDRVDTGRRTAVRRYVYAAARSSL